MTIVAKFGGTSMATSDSIKKVARILQANPERRIAVVSAPGKLPGCLKMTDLLIHNHIQACMERISLLVNDLGLGLSALHVVMAKFSDLQAHQTDAARISFGEWLSAYLLSQVMRWEFIDACDVIFFENNQVRVEIPWSAKTYVVIPGFYGYDVQTQSIKTFPRGGSDITASLIAERIGAKLCENWTDVSGVFDRDPNRYQNAEPYSRMSYQQLLNITHGGAQVFHPEAIAPLQRAQIPLNIMSTFDPLRSGTFVQ